MSDKTQELIVVEQLPVITEKLKVVSDEIDRRISDALALECTEDTVKEVKKLRSGLNKELTEFETRRKAVKSSIMSPYEAFEDVYKQYVSDKYKAADDQLKKRVDAVEFELKQRKIDEVKAYFAEYAESKSIDFVTFANANINITLTASLKSLKAQAKAFIDRICDDLALIETQEHKPEILVEYRRSLNCSHAITTVTERHRAIEEQAARLAELEQRDALDQAAVTKVEESAPLAPPIEEPATPYAAAENDNPDPVRTLVFSVTAPISMLKALKQFLVEGGYDFE